MAGIEASDDLYTRIAKGAKYTEEYEKLMSKKRIRTLTTEENKRLTILNTNISNYEKLRDEDFNKLRLKYESGTIDAKNYYSQLGKLRDAYFKEGSTGWLKYTAEINKYNNEQNAGARDKEFSSLDTQYELGEISAEEYYNKLGELRDKYFEKGSGEWLKYTQKINDYYDDEAIKDRDAEFNNLDTQFEMGEIGAEEYYNKLGELRDKYFEKGSSEWLKYTQKINDYYDDEAIKDRDTEFNNLDAQFEMGEIGAEEYYNKLGELRDKYFEKGSAEWLKYTRKINAYNDDEAIKDQEAEFNDLRARYEMGEIDAGEYYKTLGELRDKYFEKGSEEWLKYTKEINKYTSDSANERKNHEFESLKNQFRMGKISASEYYSSLGVLRDKYCKEGSSEWAKYTIEIIEHGKSVIEEYKKKAVGIFNSITDEYDKVFSGIISKQDAMYNKLAGISQIYHKISINGGSPGETYTWLQLSNIDYELKILNDYNDALTKMQDKTDGIFDSMGFDSDKTNRLKADFFAEIAKLNVSEGLGFSNYLNNMSESKLSDYLYKWAEKLDLSSAISKSLYSGESDYAIKSYVDDLNDAFSKEIYPALENIPKEFYTTGADACVEFKNGFLSAINGVISDITLEIGNRINALGGFGDNNVTNNSVTNNSNFNIYEAGSPQLTVLEILKQESKKRMLIG